MWRWLKRTVCRAVEATVHAVCWVVGWASIGVCVAALASVIADVAPMVLSAVRVVVVV